MHTLVMANRGGDEAEGGRGVGLLMMDSLNALLGRGPQELGPRILALVVESLDWDAGALWRVQPDGVTLLSRNSWHRPGVGLAAFGTASFAIPVAVGVDLPGRVLAAAEPAWIPDIGLDRNFPRAADAEAVGLHSGMAFPLLDGTQVLGVVELFAQRRRAPDEAMLATVGALGRRLGGLLRHADAEGQRERLVEELRSAQATQRRLRRAQEFLLGAARVLAQASDYAEALDRLAAVAVPPLGDLCLIDVLDDDGRLIRMAARHADPAKQAIVDELRARYGPDPEGGHPSVEVIHTGRSSWSSEMTEEFLQATTRDEHHLLLVHQLQFTSYMSVPLKARGRVLGSLTIVSAGSGRRFVEEDLALVEELAGHAAAVIVRARSHDRDRNAAHALQRSLLPSELPVTVGIAVAARYLPGTEGAEIGGDWYDVIPLDDGAVGLVIGDVAGHDIGAAAEMGQLRNALRAYAICDDSPARVLHQLRHFCEVVGIERIATVTYIWLSPATGELRVASAGHFAPLIRRALGGVETTNHSPAPPLGIDSDPPAEAQEHIGPGDTVIVHTDGLVERRNANLDDGLDRLSAVVGAAPSLDPDALCDLIIDDMLSLGDRDDDVALLVLRKGPSE